MARRQSGARADDVLRRVRYMALSLEPTTVAECDGPLPAHFWGNVADVGPEMIRQQASTETMPWLCTDSALGAGP